MVENIQLTALLIVVVCVLFINVMKSEDLPDVVVIGVLSALGSSCMIAFIATLVLIWS